MFFIGFWKKFHVGLWCSEFPLLCFVGFLLCSTGFVLLYFSSLFCWVFSPSSFFFSSLWNLTLIDLIFTWLFSSTSDLNLSLKHSIFVPDLDNLTLENVSLLKCFQNMPTKKIVANNNALLQITPSISFMSNC